MSYCIAIVGRANVGKSSLFNVIYGHRVAIVDPAPGITRDRIAREIAVSGGRRIELVDTGGVGMESARELAADVDMQIDIAISRAEMILFVVDAQTGIQPQDHEIAQRLRSSGKDVLLLANKAETGEGRRRATEFFELGLGEPLAVSAAHNVGLRELKDRIREALPAPGVDGEREGSGRVKTAFVGQRNVGKSTLINYLAGERRVVVSEIPGTTRDSVDVAFDIRDDEETLRFTAIDTAGVRRKKQLRQSVDFYSQVRTHQALQKADVVIHMIDAQRSIAKVDKQWGQLIVGDFKPAILAINKMDLVKEDVEQQFVHYIWEQLPGMRFAPLTFISAKTGENVFELLRLAHRLHGQSGLRVGTSELNDAIETITSRRPPPSKTKRRGKILFATQVGVRPPTIALFVNDSADIGDSYQRYLAAELREALPYPDVPIKLFVRRRKQPADGDRKWKDGHDPGRRVR